MRELNIVLIEPEIPQNTGNIARTCACTGARLHLVKPLGFEIEDKKLKRAGLDYWHLLDITYYESLEDFLIKTKDKPLFYLTTKAKNIYSSIEYPNGAYIVFGKETKGLPEELLISHPENCIRIPMLDGARSLNLSNAVAIVTYEAFRQQQFEGFLEKGNLTKYKW